jgi:hypothetical protein
MVWPSLAASRPEVSVDYNYNKGPLDGADRYGNRIV